MATERPKTGQVEERRADLTVEGRKIRGVVPYGTESRDMGGWTEIIDPGALDRANLDDLVATVDHTGVPIGRFPATLSLEDRSDGLHWAVDPPASREDVREAVERGDLRAGSWRMVVAKERWEGDTRHVEAIAELRDVAVVGDPAYPSAAVEYRAAPNRHQKEATSMDKQTDADNGVTEERAAAPSEEKKAAPEQSEERKAPEVKVTSEPEPVLQVEDRATPTFRTLTEEFRSKGFPGERAEISADEFRAATFGGTINVLNQERVSGVPLGYDERWVWQVPPQVSVGAGVTSVEVFQQTSRTIPAGTATVRNIDAVSAKPETASALNVATVPLKQVANVESGIPNVYLERNELATVVENDLRLGVFTGLDKLVVDGLASSGFQTPLANPYLSIRGAITTLRASGYTPDVVALTPTDSAAIDVLVTGLTGGTADFVNGPGNYGPQSIFGLRRIESKSLPASVVWDSSAHGKLYVSPISLARFEEEAGSTNTSLVRLEGHAAYGTERTAAAIRIASS